VCYFGGTLALASRSGFPSMYMDIGKRLTETCWQMYRRMPTGLSPEIVYFNTVPDATEDLLVKVCNCCIMGHIVAVDCKNRPLHLLAGCYERQLNWGFVVFLFVLATTSLFVLEVHVLFSLFVFSCH